jgi:hypothetical protein
LTDYFAVWKKKCWKCGARTLVAHNLSGWSFLPESASEGESLWQSEMPKELQDALRAEGINLQFRTTGVVREGYIANVCSNCNVVQGDWFLHEDIMEFLEDEHPADFSIIEVVDSRIVRRYGSIPELSSAQNTTSE